MTACSCQYRVELGAILKAQVHRSISSVGFSHALSVSYQQLAKEHTPTESSTLLSRYRYLSVLELPDKFL